MDELSDEDRLTVNRARRVQRFLSQPFAVAEQFTGVPGVMVSIEDTIKGFKMILDGEVDYLPEQAFLNVGTIEDAIEKGEPGYLSGKRRKISGHGRPCPDYFHALGRGSEIRGRTGNAIPANQGGIRGSQGESDFSLCGTLRGAKQAMNRICFWRLSG